MKKHSIVILAVVWMVVVVAVASSAITLSLAGVFSVSENAYLADISGASDALDSELLQKWYARLDEVREILKTEFYEELDEEALMLGAVRGMMSATEDAYTFYNTPEEMLSMTEQAQGVYEGVGIVLSSDSNGNLVVLRVYSDTPAMRSDIKPGDHIVKVNGNAVSAQNDKLMSEAISAIKDSVDPEIKITVLRGDEVIDTTLRKATVNISRTDHRMLEGDIGYIIIYQFMGNDVTGFERALKELKEQGMRSLIIDVRNNPGGLLSDVVAIADMLLPKGLIVYTEDRYNRREEYFSDATALGLPMAILVNGHSASASEILAGALQDYGLATVVGETTFGKGIVQTTIPFRSDGAGMQLTTARYFAPKGRTIHGVGITPDVEVSLDEDADLTYIELHWQSDTQLMRAVEVLKQKKQ